MKDEVRTKKTILMDSRESKVKNQVTINMSITNMPTDTQVVFRYLCLIWSCSKKKDGHIYMVVTSMSQRCSSVGTA